ncbi:MAG: biotin transporter BioY [Oscillospiraceae bacterium]|jgi:biotin transport system substrate-specific component|nr:biotin transporter BioY [Oscillospiraceae bacterium]
MSSRKIARTAIFAALICAAAPLSVSVGPIPVSLATFAIYLAAATLGKKLGTVAVVVYILIGLAGFPVFSGFGAGLSKIVGVSGGFIVGYVPLAFITGWSVEFRRTWKYLVGMVLGTIVLYAFGTAWYSALTGSNRTASIAVCVLPFLPGDAVKIIAAYKLTVNGLRVDR